MNILRTCKWDSEFKAKARQHQSDFREKYFNNTVGYEEDITHRQGGYGSYLKKEDINKGYIFIKEYKDKILKYIQQNNPKKLKDTSLMLNLLRSEHIPYNLIIPMQEDMVAFKNVFNTILGYKAIEEINKVIIEYAPMPKEAYLNDGTAFDIYIEYLHTDNTVGIIGIEVKYTEEAYPLKKNSKEDKDIHDPHSRYRFVTDNSEYYKDCVYSELIKNDFRQIWRNHILGAALKENCDVKHFHFVHLYPQGNTHFNNVIPKYRNLMTDKGNESFKDITYERFFDLLKTYYTEDRFQSWHNYLQDRYIVK